MLKKALRRHHDRRIEDKARRIYNRHRDSYFGLNKEDVSSFIKKTANNMTICSCWCCGNPRRYGRGKDGKTMQEIKSEISMKEQIVDYFGH